MKNLLVVLALVCASSAFGAVVNFTCPVIDVAPSQVVTISVTANAGYGASAITLDSIRTNNGGESVANPAPILNSMFTQFRSVGELTNTGGELVSYVGGGVAGSGISLLATGTLYSFSFHVPQLPNSSYITISALNNANFEGDVTMYDITNNVGLGNIIPGSLILHVIPEPMTMALLAIGGLVALRRRHA